MKVSRPSLLQDPSGDRGFWYIDELTGLRGVAALWVLLYHVWALSEPRLMTVSMGPYSVDVTPFFSCGWAGVDIFYGLSGFLLTLPFADAAVRKIDRPRLGPYLRHRVFRVFPAYYGQLAVLMILAWFRISGEIPGRGDLAAHLVMIHNLSFEYASSINGIWWTLPIEFSFYLVLPVLTLFLRRDRWWVLLVGAVMITLSYRYFVFQAITGKPVEYKMWLLEQLPGRIDQFTMGMLAAYFFVRSRSDSSSTRRRFYWGCSPCLLFGILGGVVLLYLLHFHSLTYWDGHLLLFVWHGCAGFFIALTIYGLATRSPLGRLLFGNGFIVKVGVISYSLYLWHRLIISWVLNLFHPGTCKGYLFPVLFGIVVPVSFGIATVSYLAIERPFLISRRKRDLESSHGAS